MFLLVGLAVAAVALGGVRLTRMSLARGRERTAMSGVADAQPRLATMFRRT
jgi:hypothetical protein